MSEDKEYVLEFKAQGTRQMPENHITSGGKGRYGVEHYDQGLVDRSISGTIYLGKGFQPVNLSKIKVVVTIPE